MPWHTFIEGKDYDREEVIEACEERIRNGGVLDVEQKRRHIEDIRRNFPRRIVWMPHGPGWARSPFNHRCWQPFNARK